VPCHAMPTQPGNMDAPRFPDSRLTDNLSEETERLSRKRPPKRDVMRHANQSGLSGPCPAPSSQACPLVSGELCPRTPRCVSDVLVAAIEMSTSSVASLCKNPC
jgi:hypothetical protein